jgi:hypothetical protein
MKFLFRLVKIKILVNWGMVHWWGLFRAIGEGTYWRWGWVYWRGNLLDWRFMIVALLEMGACRRQKLIGDGESLLERGLNRDMGGGAYEFSCNTVSKKCRLINKTLQEN